jgi:hypothetical protein
MKKALFILLFGMLGSMLLAQQGEVYFTSGGEMIFSFANIEYEGTEPSSVIRWSPVFNIQGMMNVDLGKNFGLFTGLAIRNVGYIFDDYKTINDVGDEITVKKKFRTYNLGIPAGIKIGKIDKAFLYGGYEVEFPFHYKEKTFIDDNKDKITAWFSNRVEQIQHGFLVGIQFPYGANIKFKYYLSSFHNQDYVASQTSSKPYENLDVNVFYISLNFALFRNTDFYHSEGKKSKEYF